MSRQRDILRILRSRQSVTRHAVAFYEHHSLKRRRAKRRRQHHHHRHHLVVMTSSEAVYRRPSHLGRPAASAGNMQVWRTARPHAIGFGARSSMAGAGFMQSALGRTLKREGLKLASDTLSGLSRGESLKSAATGAIKGAAKRNMKSVTSAIKSRFGKKSPSNQSAGPRGKKKKKKKTSKKKKKKRGGGGGGGGARRGFLSLRARRQPARRCRRRHAQTR